jgi:hypothetical protein
VVNPFSLYNKDRKANTGDAMVPRRALVRPRVVAPAGGEIRVLEEEIQRLLDTGEAGEVALLGPAG